MPLTRHSRIIEAWRNPVGHDILVRLMRQLGRDEGWAQGPLVAGRPLASLDKLAGPGFADMVVELAAGEADKPAKAAPEMHSWWQEAVIYQIYLPSFMDADHDGVGDLAGAAQRLPYLASLGADTLLLRPLLDAEPGAGRAVRDHYTPNPDYGTMADFEAFTQQAHSRGMRVMVGLDLVTTSEQHAWFKQAAASHGEDSFFILRPGLADAPPNNWNRGDDTPVWHWYPQLGAWALGVLGQGRLDLNWDNPGLRAEMARVLHFWAGKGADGFWLGSANLISKSSFDDGAAAAMCVSGMCGYERFVYGPRLHRYLRELRADAHLKDSVLMMGEVWGTGAGMARQLTGAGRGELDTVADAGHLMPRPRPRPEDARLELADIKSYYLRWIELYGAERWMTLFFETPETPRIVSRFGASPLYRPILAKLLASMLFTLRGTPMLYQGQELGLPNLRLATPEDLKDPEARRLYDELRERLGGAAALQGAAAASADHAQAPMPWSAGPGGGFTGARPWRKPHDGAEYLNAAAQMEDRNSVWRHTQQLIELRRGAPCLVYGSFSPVFVKNRRVFCYFRVLENEKWYVEMNLTEREITRPGRLLPTMRLMLSNYDAPARALRPFEANVYRCG